MSVFEALAAERYKRGVERFRGGDYSKPFEGDPVAESLEELLDVFNYAGEPAFIETLGHEVSETVRDWAKNLFELVVGK